MYDVYILSCSWGPDDDGRTIDGPHPLGKVRLSEASHARFISNAFNYENQKTCILQHMTGCTSAMYLVLCTFTKTKCWCFGHSLNMPIRHLHKTKQVRLKQYALSAFTNI